MLNVLEGKREFMDFLTPPKNCFLEICKKLLPQPIHQSSGYPPPLISAFDLSSLPFQRVYTLHVPNHKWKTV